MLRKGVWIAALWLLICSKNTFYLCVLEKCFMFKKVFYFAITHKISFVLKTKVVLKFFLL